MLGLTMFLKCRNRILDLTQPVVMGVLNVTPDSFSDGGRYLSTASAIEQARRMAEEGAAIIDVGGESTRPGAQSVSAPEEMERVVPVIDSLARRLDVLISVDTSKPDVMRSAVAAGAHLINDVRALQGPGALEAAAQSGAGVCLMHMQGDPRTMQIDPQYVAVVEEVRAFLQARMQDAIAAGIETQRIVLDPGIGFGKRLEHNLALLAKLPCLTELGPVLIGVSRKSMFGALLGRGVEERLAGGLACAAAAVLAGARIIRTHDVRETVDAIKVAAALRAVGYRIQ